MMRWLWLSVALLAAVQQCSPAKILTLVPFGAKSHSILFDRLSIELAKRGHQVTFVTAFSLPSPVPNLTQIIVPNFLQELMDEMGMNVMSMRNSSSVVGSMVFLPLMGAQNCEKFLADPQIQKLIHTEEKFDVVFGEAFISESILAGFTYKNKASLIALGTSAPHIWTNYMVGNPDPMSYVPNMMLGYPTKMTFWQRVANTVTGLMTEVMHSAVQLRQQDAIMRKYFGDHLPPISEIIKNTSLVLSNYHHSLGFPRPYVPNMVDIGGFHFGPPKALPQELQKYMDESKNGVILFSMGSNLKSIFLSPETLKEFMNGFAKLKQNVLWKFENETLPGKPKNVRISKWLPQSDLLAHPNLKLFITHGGLLSTTEAIHRGVPIVGIPMFAEQPKNMKEAEQAGIGRMLNFDHITADSLAAMANEVLDNPKYREAVQLKSRLLQDTPLPPMETAIYWIEYVIRHKGAPHLRSAALDLAWYQLYLLDVFAFLAVAAAAVLAAEFYILRCIYRKLCVRKKSDVVSKKKKKN